MVKIQRNLWSTTKSSIFFLNSTNSFFSSFSAPTNDFPLSEMIVVGHPWCDTKRLRAWRKDSLDGLSTISRWIDRMVAQVNSAPQALVDLFLPN